MSETDPPNEGAFIRPSPLLRPLGLAFGAVDYEGRFSLAASGMTELERLFRLAESKDVWLVCQCDVGRRCHRELVLLIAHRALGSDAEEPRQDHPAFSARLASAGSILDGRMRRSP